MRWNWRVSRDYQGIDPLPLRLTALPPRAYSAGSWETKSGEEACHRYNLFGRHAVKVRYCQVMGTAEQKANQLTSIKMQPSLRQMFDTKNLFDLFPELLRDMSYLCPEVL